MPNDPIPGGKFRPSDFICDNTPSKRELEVIRLINCGHKNREIAEIIGVTESIIKNHLRDVYDKLGLWNRVEMALWYEARVHEGTISQT